MSKYSSYILYMLTSILVVLLYVNDFGPLNDLQRSVDDMLCRVTAQEGRRPNVAIVAIDGAALDEYGQWPWNLDLVGDLTAAVGNGGPKTVVLDLDFNEDARQDSAGYTKVLAEQISWVENVVLPYDVALATYRSEKTNNPEHLFDFSLNIESPLGIMDERSSLQVRKVFLPADKLLNEKPNIGFKYQMPDNDRVLRHQSLTMNYEGYYYPSMSLLAAANFLDVKPANVSVVEGKVIKVGDSRTVPINSHGEIYINYSADFPFATYSAAQVLSEGFNLKQFEDKLVVIALDDPGQTLYFKTPVDDDIPDYVARASVIENIINDNMLEHKSDMSGTSMLILFAIGGLYAFILSRVSLLYRMLILLGSLVLLANVNYFIITSMRMIAETVYVGFEILLFMLVAPILDTRLIAGEEEQSKAVKQKLPKVDLEKGMPEKSVEPLRPRKIIEAPDDPANQPTSIIPTDTEVPSDHQSINIDGVDIASDETGVVETSEESTTALESGTIDDAISVDADSEEPVVKALSDSDGVIEQVMENSTPTPIPGSNAPLTQLGRYQITGTLGKGAMGHVYRGIDPAINRPIALKTIRLDFISDPEEMEELKVRLHREAQAAGKLSHPNIVTIYDVGSDGSLQYIAMEYIEGQTLEEMIKKKTKFNYKIIAQIIIQICSAMQYAHEQNIVHRDIKPANVMITKDYRVKVMDFGIARIDSNSMTKTGIAMGTPNYISPEQLQGKPVDRRADIFSLGVVLYELLIGKRPFKGENITSLIYSILHKEPEKPSNLVPSIPFLFDQIIGRALEKDPSKRYQTAAELSDQLGAFIEAFSTKR
ncbi:MAG: serine/threonine-protein kinase [bacterium]|nr:serine/threonine-protein kinase [bacterium]